MTFDTFDGEHLPYTDNLVNFLVVSDRYRLSRDEMLRVLTPNGAMLIDGEDGWKVLVKPWPKDIDQWSHYLHGPDNNAVARDTVVGPPRHTQWLAAPLWTRNHHKLNSISSVVTTNGRIFYIVDEATSANMAVPGKWKIVARDAFNGVELWKKPMAHWVSHNIRFRVGPPQITRLLVAREDRVYAPLGLNEPISVIHAASGKTLKTYEGTEGAEEIVLTGETLLVLKGSPVAEQAVGSAIFGKAWKSPNEKSIVAVDVESGKIQWRWSDPRANPMPETLGSDGKNVYFQINDSVTCLDLNSGKPLWTFGQRGKRKPNRGFGKYTLVVADGVVLCKLAGNLVALSAEDGKELWRCKAGSGFHAPLDVFVIDGTVWQGSHVSDSVAPPPVDDFDKGRDLHTGEIKRENTILVDLQSAGHHHRCYREKATSRYIIAGKRGFEMMDLIGDNHSRNNWVRGSCQYGILPANGLLYAPPHSCGCYMESMLWGFWALAAERSVVKDARTAAPQRKRLEKGPAYGKVGDPTAEADLAESWPQLRHDPRRSGVASTVLGADLKQAWKAKIGGRLTPPVVAGGKVVLAAVDENAVYALDESTGKVVWRYTVGGRVDSPPAIYRGTVLFGSADGWVYCLKLDDGQLAWRFLAAPADLRTVALGQIESLWPVHGSVLVLDGVAYCAAGRSTWLDGGIDLYGLDPASGRVVCKHQYQSRHPKINEGKENAKEEHVDRVAQNRTDYRTFLAPDLSDAFSMAGGCIRDVLVSDGKNVFMHHAKFDAKLQQQQKMTRHLFSTSGLLDGTENHRSHWVLGTGNFSLVPVAYSWIVNSSRQRWAKTDVPFALMMVYEDRGLWSVRRKGINGNYGLCAMSNTPFSDDEEALPDFPRRSQSEKKNVSRWTADLPVRPRAMLKSGNRLYLGCMPTEIPDNDPHAAYEGRRGATILIVSASDGSRLADYPIESPVVWDGLAAAKGRLFASTKNGEVLCFGRE